MTLGFKTGLCCLLVQALAAIAMVSPAAADPAPPTASFGYSPPAPYAGQTVTFDASASSGGTESIASYRWDFGDGSVQTHTGRSRPIPMRCRAATR